MYKANGIFRFNCVLTLFNVDIHGIEHNYFVIEWNLINLEINHSN